MSGCEILVIAETPSLGRAIADLLEARGLELRLIDDTRGGVPAFAVENRDRLLVVACNSGYCETARRYARGELSGARMIVVGSRDPVLAGLPGVVVVPLPLDVSLLVSEIERSLGSPAAFPPGSPGPTGKATPPMRVSTSLWS
jgi:hypothetical protein